MIKKLFTFCFILLSTSLNVFAYSEDNISALEYAKYGMNYPHESLGERLNRLETDYFGMAQTGDIESRLSNLSRINSNTKTAIMMPASKSYYTNTPKSAIKSLWDNITSGLSDDGFMTGYTPPMNMTTTQGYANDIYNNNMYNYWNNPSSFCPYHNRSHMTHPRNYYNNRFNGVNQFVPRHHYNHMPNMAFNPYTQYERPYTNRTTYYTPPNVETKSSIHILRD